MKPLPPVPVPALPLKDASLAPGKALPEIPWQPDYAGTILWVAGLALWFIGVVLLLPVVLKGDALPGLNQVVRRLWGWALAGT